MQKVIVIGNSGAGKSTFARKLRDATGLPLYYLDMLWHKADHTTISKEKFDLRLRQLLKQDRWIIDGNYQRTLEVRLQECDTVFLLDFPLEVCLSGAAARVGTKREDMPWTEETFDEDFRQWIIGFPQNQLPQIYRLLERFKEARNVVVFKSRKETNDYLRMLQRSCSN